MTEAHDIVANRENLERLIRYSDSEESYIRHYIGLADAKATFCFSVYIVLLGGLLSDEAVRRIFSASTSCWELATVILTFLLLTTGAAFSFWTVAPRLTSSSAEGLIFFNSISNFKDGEHYTTEVLKLTDTAVLREKLTHCYDTAKVCSRKYARLRVSIWILPFALAPAFWIKFMVQF